MTRRFRKIPGLFVAAALGVTAFATACDPIGAACNADPGLDSSKYVTPDTVGLPGNWNPDDGVPDPTDAWTPASVVNGTLEVTQDNATYTDVEVFGSIDVHAENATFCRVRVHGRIWNQFDPGSEGGDGHQYFFTVTDSVIGDGTDQSDGVTQHGAIGPGRYHAARNEVYGSDGFRVSEPHQGGSNDVVIRDNAVLNTDPACALELHLDGVQGFFGGQNVEINHNTIDIRHADGCGENGAVFMADCSESATVINNLLIGGGFTLRIHDDHGNDSRCPASGDVGPWGIGGNRIADWGFGPALTTNTECNNSQTMTWADNRRATVSIVDGEYVVTAGDLVPC